MILTGPHWISGPWPGRLAVASRPRGGDWLADEISAWRDSGIHVVVSLLAPEEAADLGLAREKQESESLGVEFLDLPIPDRGVPASGAEAGQLVERIESRLKQGRNVLIHCRQGIGRSGLIAASLLVRAGDDPEAAFERVTQARGVPIPETEEQRKWVVDWRSP